MEKRMYSWLIASGVIPLVGLCQERETEILTPLPFVIRFSGESNRAVFKGRIFLPHKYPVNNLIFASGWTWRANRKPQYQPWEAALTEVKDGILNIHFKDSCSAFFAFDSTRSLGGVCILADEQSDREILLYVRPVIEVLGRVVCNDRVPQWAKTKIAALTADRQVAEIASYYFEDASGADVRLLLPAGRYELLFKATGAQHRIVPVTLDNQKAVVDLENIVLTPCSIEKGILPDKWSVTDARGVTKDVRLSNYRGKWVLLEFWAYW